MPTLDLFLDLIESFDFFGALVAVQNVVRPLAVDLDEALELLVLDRELLDDLLGLAVYFKPRCLDVGSHLLAREVCKAHRIALAVVHREIAVLYLGSVELLGNRLADNRLCQLNRHVVESRLKDKNLLLEGVEVGNDALVDIAQVAVLLLELLVAELVTVDFRNEIYHEAVLHIVIKNGVRQPRAVAAGRTLPREQSAVKHTLALLLVDGRVDACIYDCLAQLAAHRADDSLVDLFFGHSLTPLSVYYINIVEFSQVNLKKILILLK